MRATIQERGNGLAGAGEYVAGDDGEVYRVVGTFGPIHTGGPGNRNGVSAEVELADWSDVDDDAEPYCSAIIEDEAGPCCPECGHPQNNSSGWGVCTHPCHVR